MDPEERLTNALSTLKSELVSLRGQDVQLMKQMIGINDTIKKMTNREGCKDLEKPVSHQSTPLIRIQSTPDFRDMRRGSCSGSSVSSMDDVFNSYEDISSEDGDCGSPPTSSSFLTVPSINRRRRSVSPHSQPRHSEYGDTYYEDILKKNIKLWKHSKHVSNDIIESSDNQQSSDESKAKCSLQT